MYSRIQISLVALAATLSLAVPSAFAQYKFESPDGHQTISPSQMPQQPSVNEIMSGAHGRTIPPNAPDIPGVPNFQGATTGSGASEAGMPQRIPNAQPQGGKQSGNQMQQNNMQQKTNGQNGANGQAGGNKVPQANATVPANPASPGSLILPQGESSTQRNGPVEPTPLWQRGILAVWLLLQFAAMVCVGVALTMMKNREIEEQGGHLIREDYQEPWSVIETSRRPLENR